MSVRRILVSTIGGLLAVLVMAPRPADAQDLQAGVARVDITDRTAGPESDPLYAKALVLRQAETTVVLITIDAVAIGEIGRIGNNFLPQVRGTLHKDLQISPEGVLVNASHCHGIVRADIVALTVQAVKDAAAHLVPVRVGTGRGELRGIMENRRLKMKDGREIDVRRAYSLPPDGDLEGMGPVDPEIGVLRIDRVTGEPLAVVYNFACHPIQGTPDGGNTADFPGYASRAIEETLGGGALALFVQGCGGDINPVAYKTVHRPKDAAAMGDKLGLAVLKTWRAIEPRADHRLRLATQTLSVPRARDFAARISALETERARLVDSLTGVHLNVKTFVELLIKHRLAEEFPSEHAYRYLQEQIEQRSDLVSLDREQRGAVAAYLKNVVAMEEITRLNTNLALLKKHAARAEAAGGAPLDAELKGLRVGEFVLVTFPGELTVEHGLAIKQGAPHKAVYVAGYTNGYLYYLPTQAQRMNTGFAQEDCDCQVAPEWEAVFRAGVKEVLDGL